MRKQKTIVPDVSVIILSYNTKEITLTCLKKLKESIDYLGEYVETVVVENGSDGTGDIIRKNYPWIKLIEPNKNTGFAIGQNLGINNANKDSSYYLLLNSDAYVEKETLKKCIDFMKANQNCDVLGCKLVYKDGELQFSSGYLPTPASIVSWAWGLDLLPGINRVLSPFHPNYIDFFNKDRKVGWVTGAFMFLRNYVVRKTKGFDEKYFMYGEEIEWCKRIADQGYEIWYTPRFEIVHLLGASAESKKKAYLREIEGIYYYINKHYPGDLRWLKYTVKFGMLLRFVAFSLIGNTFRAKVHLEAAKIK